MKKSTVAIGVTATAAVLTLMSYIADKRADIDDDEPAAGDVTESDFCDI